MTVVLLALPTFSLACTKEKCILTVCVLKIYIYIFFLFNSIFNLLNGRVTLSQFSQVAVLLQVTQNNTGKTYI